MCINIYIKVLLEKSIVFINIQGIFHIYNIYWCKQISVIKLLYIQTLTNSKHDMFWFDKLLKTECPHNIPASSQHNIPASSQHNIPASSQHNIPASS